jgi:osmoprotectant transport system permease protein
VEFLGDVIGWYTDPARWTGRNSLPELLGGHLTLSVAALLLALLIAMPVGLYIGHTGRGAQVAVAVSNIGRAVPSLGWLGIVYPITTALLQRAGHGFLPALIALVALGLPPIVTNTFTGIREVDDDLREAGHGVGMTEVQLLWRVEVPVALPVILAGLRSSAVAIVATAPLTSLVGADTLGTFILAGLDLSNEVQVFAAALLVVAIALLTELGLGWLERRATSPGLTPTELGTDPGRPIGELGGAG